MAAMLIRIKAVVKIKKLFVIKSASDGNSYDRSGMIETGLVATWLITVPLRFMLYMVLHL